MFACKFLPTTWGAWVKLDFDLREEMQRGTSFLPWIIVTVTSCNAAPFLNDENNQKRTNRFNIENINQDGKTMLWRWMINKMTFFYRFILVCVKQMMCILGDKWESKVVVWLRVLHWPKAASKFTVWLLPRSTFTYQTENNCKLHNVTAKKLYLTYKLKQHFISPSLPGPRLASQVIYRAVAEPGVLFW